VRDHRTGTEIDDFDFHVIGGACPPANRQRHAGFQTLAIGMPLDRELQDLRRCAFEAGDDATGAAVLEKAVADVNGVDRQDRDELISSSISFAP
jgi:hypothetical protein